MAIIRSHSASSNDAIEMSDAHSHLMIESSRTLDKKSQPTTNRQVLNELGLGKIQDAIVSATQLYPTIVNLILAYCFPLNLKAPLIKALNDLENSPNNLANVSSAEEINKLYKTHGLSIYDWTTDQKCLAELRILKYFDDNLDDDRLRYKELLYTATKFKLFNSLAYISERDRTLLTSKTTLHLHPLIKSKQLRSNALIDAIRSCQYTFALWLLKNNGPWDLNWSAVELRSSNESLGSPLVLCVKENHLEFAYYLLIAGADPAYMPAYIYMNDENCDRPSAITQAKKNNNLQMLSLFSAFHPEVRSQHLAPACLKRCKDFLKPLLDSYQNFFWASHKKRAQALTTALLSTATSVDEMFDAVDFQIRLLKKENLNGRTSIVSDPLWCDPTKIKNAYKDTDRFCKLLQELKGHLAEFKEAQTNPTWWAAEAQLLP